MLKINSEKAIQIAKEQIRRWRETAYAENDVRIQNSLADMDDEARYKAVAYRDYLRDLPHLCEGKDQEELKALMEGVLGFEAFIRLEEGNE